MANDVAIAAMQPGDWELVRAIYLEGIATGTATFETAAPPWAAWDAAHLATPRMVARNTGAGSGAVIGWAALSAASGRCVYAGVVDESVYVAASARGQGVGRALLSALCEVADAAGLWTIQAGIFPENAASLHLHQTCGFRIVGRREKLGKLDGVWRDVMLLERRSRMPALN